jgi:hypothetical protein
MGGCKCMVQWLYGTANRVVVRKYSNKVVGESDGEDGDGIEGVSSA